MTLLTLGFAVEFRGDGVNVNCLWPRTTIAAAAVMGLMGGDEAMSRGQRSETVVDAADAVPTSDNSGKCFIDDVALPQGIDLDSYRATPTQARCSSNSSLIPHRGPCG